MVNKAVVGVIGVILITTLGVGALVGLQGGGGPADDTNTDTNTNGGGNGQDPAPSSNETAVNQTDANATATPTAEPKRTAIPGRQFTEKDVANNLTERINAWREAEGLDPLRTGGSTAERIREMAMQHSVAMANEGELAHTINNVSSGDRYRNHDLYDACMYRPPDKSRAVYQPDHPNDSQMEAIAETVAGDTYSVGNETRFNEDEEAVAGALLEELKSSNESSNRILAPGLTKIGVGVEVTRDGAVYSTVNVCGG